MTLACPASERYHSPLCTRISRLNRNSSLLYLGRLMLTSLTVGSLTALFPVPHILRNVAISNGRILVQLYLSPSTSKQMLDCRDFAR